MIQTRKIILAGLVLVSIFFISCQDRGTSLVEQYSDHMIFSPGALAEVNLSFNNTDKGATPYQPVKEIGLPEGTILLMSAKAVTGQKTLGELADIKVVQPFAKPCQFMKRWLNETKIVSLLICIPIPDDLAPPTFPNMDAVPVSEFTSPLTKHKRSKSYFCYDATVKLVGMIECRDFCFGSDIICTFISEGVSISTESPDRDPDIELWTPCNSMNTCP